ncbi:hypothetical protein SAMN05519104_6122 [Rhizobiales bacterium GAS188]|nr:hypothetical protein SAMN05519104_6122 [Rhizobiales bacterium GAS188]
MRPILLGSTAVMALMAAVGNADATRAEVGSGNEEVSRALAASSALSGDSI